MATLGGAVITQTTAMVRSVCTLLIRMWGLKAVPSKNSLISQAQHILSFPRSSIQDTGFLGDILCPADGPPNSIGCHVYYKYLVVMETSVLWGPTSSSSAHVGYSCKSRILTGRNSMSVASDELTLVDAQVKLSYPPKWLLPQIGIGEGGIGIPTSALTVGVAH